MSNQELERVETGKDLWEDECDEDTPEEEANEEEVRPANIFHVGRFFLVLCYVAYCGDFPQRMIYRIGGFSEWTRKVTYRALEEGYLLEWHGEFNKHKVDSLRISAKGLDYIAGKSPEVFAQIAAQRDTRNPRTRLNAQGIVRSHALASVLVIAQNAGALVIAKDKPSLMYDEMMRSKRPIDPQQPYFYTSHEIRRALQEKAPELTFKGSQLAGVIVQGEDSYFLYFAGSRRIYWMRPTEENYVGAIQSLLNVRGFSIRTVRQVVIGNRMTTAKKHYKRRNRRAKPYFVLSEFFNNCYFVTNNDEGDAQLRIMIHEDLMREASEKALAGCRIPERKLRGYDAIEESSGRPVLLNFAFDMLPLETAYMAGEVLGKDPIVLCFDDQVEVMQSMVEPQVEIRGIGSAKDYA